MVDGFAPAKRGQREINQVTLFFQPRRGEIRHGIPLKGRAAAAVSLSGNGQRHRGDPAAPNADRPALGGGCSGIR